MFFTEEMQENIHLSVILILDSTDGKVVILELVLEYGLILAVWGNYLAILLVNFSYYEKEMGLAYTVAQDKIAIIKKYVLRFRGVINH